MAAVLLQLIPSFSTKSYSKNSLFISANTYEKHIVSKEYCIARHDDKICLRGLSVYTVQVPIQGQNYYQEWTTL